MAVVGLGRTLSSWKPIERVTQTPLNDPFHSFSVSLNQNTKSGKYQVVTQVRNERLSKNEFRETKTFNSENEARDLYLRWVSHTEFGNNLNKGETLLSKVRRVKDNGIPNVSTSISSRGIGSTSTSGTGK